MDWLLTLTAAALPVALGYVLTRRRLKLQDVKTQEIHVLVNNRLDAALAEVRQLKADLVASKAQTATAKRRAK